MNVPKARKLASGTWFIQLRLGGESIPVSGATEKAVTREAMRIKAEYKAGAREKRTETTKKVPTLAELADAYIESRRASKSPSTIRIYDRYKRLYFKSIINQPVNKIDWQAAINAEIARKISGKTLHSAWGFYASVLKSGGYAVPKVNLLPVASKERECLFAEDIPVFLDTIRGERCELPALLALHSLRASEVWGLNGGDINLTRREIHVCRALVTDANGEHILKESGKTKAATRTVPIMIDRLYELLREAKKGELVVTMPQGSARDAINKCCAVAGLPRVGLHGLRHSFASLAVSLGMPERVTMQIGGWDDAGTMRRIYTHISSKQVAQYSNAMTEFYKNANKNANKSEKA